MGANGQELERLKEFGITKGMLIEQAAKMGLGEIVNAKGQITDMKAMNEALFALMDSRYKGGMELQSKTFKGMVSNAKDVMGTIAREMSKPIFEKFKDGLKSILPVGNALVSFVRGDLSGSSKILKDAFGPEMGNQIMQGFQIIKNGVDTAKQAFFNMQPTLNNLWGIFKDIAPIVGVVLAGAFKTLTTVIPPLVNGLTGIVKAITGWEGFIPVVTGLVSAFVTYKSIMAAIAIQQGIVNGVTKISIALSKAQRAAHLAMVISGGGLRGALLAMRAAMSALNLTMLANPFVLIAALIVGLGTAFVVAYKKSETFRKFIDGLWASIKKFGSYIATEFMADVGEIKDLFKRIAEQWKKDWSDVINWFTVTLPKLVTDFGKWFNSIDQNARNSVSNMRKKVVEYIVGLVVDFAKWIDSLDKNARNSISNMRKAVVGYIVGLVGDFAKQISSMKKNASDSLGKIKTYFTNAWKSVKDNTSTVFSSIYKTISGKIGDIVTASKNMPGKIGSVIRDKAANAINAMASMAKSLKDKLDSRISDIKNAASGMPGKIGSAIKNKVSSATSAMTSLGSSLKTKLTDKINDIKDAAASIPGKIGSAIKNKVKSATNAMSDLAKSLIKKFKEALGIASPSKVFFDMAGWIIKGLVNGLSAGNLKDLGTKAFKDFAGGAFDTLNNIKSWVSGGFDLGNVGGNVTSWMKQAMALTKTPMSWLQPLTTMAMKESGGKTGPGTINTWDINATKYGTPSMGLMQTIMPTFRSFALPGLGDIMNPVHNAVAAIRYIKSRYGTVFNTPGIKSMMHGGPYKGYEFGGFVKQRQLAWLAENNKPEAIVPLVGNRMDPFAIAVAKKLGNIFERNTSSTNGGFTVHTEFHQSEPLSPSEIKRKQLQLARQLANEWGFGG
ncbi:transglycosylase SLT domain-containing protein [Peribacillus frigoritolerans]|uniref:transglycosylase SLT domain-containing protein n=1 Tax=Peribacillus frigoritolerans TaxID=450367 RepID=UPI0021CEDEC6|nr:transglycosylase SLT domain-containing protein [Peribacillus frigoritolerans]MCU6603848.1 transglycosylase SLT domain-containing protein [Peribacillus frigoritolerans]